MARSLLFVLVGSLSLGLPACSGCDASTPSPGSSATTSSATGPQPAAFDTSVVVRPERKTTSESIALANLDGQIEQLGRRLGGHPEELGTRVELCGRLLLRARWLGRSSDLERALELAEPAPVQHPEQVDAWLLRARARAAVHRFADALADLDVAATKTRDEGLWRAQRGAVLAAVGRWDEALVLLERERSLWPKPTNLMMEAALRAQMGELERAEALFVRAETEHRDPSPIELVSLLEARAAAFERAGDLIKATALYREASSRLPRHAHVATHLAALLPPSEGVALLAPLADEQADPDLLATLGALRELVEPGRGAADLARASRRFDELCERLPLAYADHAAHFYLGAGKRPEEALRLALLNLEQRRTPDAYELAVRALEAGGMRERACALATEAAQRPYASPALRARAEALGCPPITATKPDARSAPPGEGSK